MVIVQMGEEQMRDFGRGNTELEQPVMGAKAVVEDNHVVAGLDHIAGAHTPQGRRRSARSQQPDSHLVFSESFGARAILILDETACYLHKYDELSLLGDIALPKHRR
jgi:hypothetical protein